MAVAHRGWKRDGFTPAKKAKALETLAWERATQGTPEKVIRNGEAVQIKVKPSDAIVGMLLRASDPKKYGRLSRGGASRKQIERKLRRKIEVETREKMRRELVATDEEVKDALVKAPWAHGIRARAGQSAAQALAARDSEDRE